MSDGCGCRLEQNGVRNFGGVLQTPCERETGSCGRAKQKDRDIFYFRCFSNIQKQENSAYYAPSGEMGSSVQTKRGAL